MSAFDIDELSTLEILAQAFGFALRGLGWLRGGNLSRSGPCLVGIHKITTLFPFSC